MQFQFTVTQRIVQIGFHRPARLRFGIHRGLEEAMTALAVLLGAIQSEICIFQQRGRVGPILWRQGDADTGSRYDAVTIDLEGLCQGVDDGATDLVRTRRTILHHDGEFVAAQPSDEAGGASPRQPGRHFA